MEDSQPLGREENVVQRIIEVTLRYKRATRKGGSKGLTTRLSSVSDVPFEFVG